MNAYSHHELTNRLTTAGDHTLIANSISHHTYGSCPGDIADRDADQRLQHGGDTEGSHTRHTDNSVS